MKKVAYAGAYALLSALSLWVCISFAVPLVLFLIAYVFVGAALAMLAFGFANEIVEERSR